METPIVISMGGRLTREQFPIANFRVRQVRPDEGASLESSSLYKAMAANLVDHSFFYEYQNCLPYLEDVSEVGNSE